MTEEPYAESDTRYSYRSELVDVLRERGSLQAGRLRLLLPQKFGFCWGVDRALAMVADARRDFPGRRLWLLNSIIHNPRVNADMQRMGIGFLHGPYAQPGALDGLGPADVVIVPAFSSPVEEMEPLRARGCEIVDTTCPWVIKPHKRTLRYVEQGFTTVIHGTVGHDETRATCSLVSHAGGRYVVVHDLAEAEALARCLEGTLSGLELLRALPAGAVPPDFDTARDLRKIGLINQTTMLASESRAVAARLRAALVRRDGADSLAEFFRDFDTICAATQENQDAASAVVDARPDLFLVVGGYDSSNTRNLARVGDGLDVPSYHIEGPECIEPGRLRHRDRHSGVPREQRGWLPDGPVTIAFTAGASTPDTVLDEVIRRVVEVAGERMPSAQEAGR